MWNWIIDNKEWVFSGVGVVIIGTIIQFGIRYLRARRSTSQPSAIELLSVAKPPAQPPAFELLPLSFEVSLRQEIPQVGIWIFVVNHLSGELAFQTLRVDYFHLSGGPSLENIPAVGDVRVSPRQSRQVLLRRPLVDSEARAVERSQQQQRNPSNATFSVTAMGVADRKQLRQNFPSLSVNGWVSGIATETRIGNLESKIEPRVSADNLLHPREQMPSFESSLQQGEEIWMAGRSLAGLLDDYDTKIRHAAANGKRFRFLVMNPDNPSLMKAVSDTSSSHPDALTVEQEVRDAIFRFNLIVENSPKDSIELRVMDYIPPYTYRIVDGRKPSGQMVVEQFGYKISTSERLHMHLTRAADSQSFTFYLEQFDRMWLDAETDKFKAEAEKIRAELQPSGVAPVGTASQKVPMKTTEEQEEILVLSATYGMGETRRDVTGIIRAILAAARTGHASLLVENDNLGGDPVKRKEKELVVVYMRAGEKLTTVIPEHKELSLL